MWNKLVSATLLIWLTANTALCQQTCYDYVLISARGTSEPQGHSVQFADMINNTLNTLPNGIEYDLEYPASTDLISSAAEGGEALRTYINSGISACPNQSYAILGYSQGASATALGLQNITDTTSAAFQAIKAILVLGNPGHVAGSDANVDQLGGRTTQNYNGSFLFEGLGALPDAYYGANKILDICYQGDPICASGYPNATFLPNHIAYASNDNVQNMATDFMTRNLRQDGNMTDGDTPAPGSASSISLEWSVMLVAGATMLLIVL